MRQHARHVSRSLTLAAIAAGSLLGFAGPAAADIDGAWADTNAWFFDITHMPDLDQRRDGLANGGNAHCVTTATMNVMAYLAAHGQPSLFPGVANWRAPSLHDYMTFWIDQMGQSMGTTGSGGTNGAGLPAGDMLLVSRSTTNYDPALHQDWINIDPVDPEVEPIPDCVADLDDSGDVGFGDLVLLLTAWGTIDPYADLAPNGGDGVVDLDDLLTLLANWGPCN